MAHLSCKPTWRPQVFLPEIQGVTPHLPHSSASSQHNVMLPPQHRQPRTGRVGNSGVRAETAGEMAAVHWLLVQYCQQHPGPVLRRAACEGAHVPELKPPTPSFSLEVATPLPVPFFQPPPGMALPSRPQLAGGELSNVPKGQAHG